MAETVELAAAICKLIQSSSVPIPISLMNHTVEEAAAIIGAVVEICDRDGVKLREICIDPELAMELGLAEGGALPHGGRPTIQLQGGLGRQLLFKKHAL